MTNLQHKIVAGPSREELFDALRLRHENRLVRMTTQYHSRTAGEGQRSFEDNSKLVFSVSVDSIEIGDLSGHKWILTLTDDDGLSYLAYFDTERRHGWLKLSEKGNRWLEDDENTSNPDGVDHELERLDHELERAEHAMTHPNRHR